VSIPSLSAARAIAVASIGSDFPGSRAARLEDSVQPRRDPDHPIAAGEQRALQAAGHVPAVLERPHALGVELAGEAERFECPVI
jgi:hypothetical protein